MHLVFVVRFKCWACATRETPQLAAAGLYQAACPSVTAMHLARQSLSTSETANHNKHTRLTVDAGTDTQCGRKAQRLHLSGNGIGSLDRHWPARRPSHATGTTWSFS